jgi:hypothetical protein
MINHDPNNPRTKNYSIIKFLLRNIEFIAKNIFYFLGVFINCIIFRSKKNYLNIGNYEDTRYINYLFYSLKKKYGFSYNINFQILNFVKKIGIINFLIHSSPNFRIKKKDMLKITFNNFEESTENLNFNTNYFHKLKDVNKDSNLFLPYYLYPRIYNKDYKKLDKLKNNNKQIRIFFSGSSNKQVYGRFSWINFNGDKFLNRVEIINFILNEFREKVYLLNSYDQLNDLVSSNKPIVLSLNDKLIKKTKTNLTNLEHLNLISMSNFFITAPGADMPLCHHLIECIKMKSIPITSCNEFLVPRLNENDHISFNNFDELNLAIKTALSMDQDKIVKIQNNLDVFYKNNLSPEAFFRNFENRKTNNIIACNDVESVERYKVNI